MKELKEICLEDDLVAVAARKGVSLTPIEAYTALTSLNNDDISLAKDDFFNLYYCYSNGTTEQATLRDVYEYAKEIADEDYIQTAGDANLRKENFQCAKDLFIIESALKKVSRIVAPTIRKYKLGIVANYKFFDEIEAASWAEAEGKVRERWENGEYEDYPRQFAGIFITQSSTV